MLVELDIALYECVCVYVCLLPVSHSQIFANFMALLYTFYGFTSAYIHNFNALIAVRVN